MSLIETKKGAIPDGITQSQRPVELKPDTASGQRAAASQLERYETAMGRRGIRAYYDQSGARRFERTPYREYRVRPEVRSLRPLP